MTVRNPLLRSARSWGVGHERTSAAAGSCRSGRRTARGSGRTGRRPERPPRRRHRPRRSPPGEATPAPEDPGDWTQLRVLPITASPTQACSTAGHPGGAAGSHSGALLGIVTCSSPPTGAGWPTATSPTRQPPRRRRRLLHVHLPGAARASTPRPTARSTAAAHPRRASSPPPTPPSTTTSRAVRPIDFDASSRPLPPPPTRRPRRRAAGQQPGDRHRGGVGARRVAPAGTECALEGDVVRQATCEYGDVEDRSEVGPDGTFTGGPFVAHRLLFDGFDPVDCATNPCAFVAGRPLGTGRSAQAVLAFDPASLPRPADALRRLRATASSTGRPSPSPVPASSRASAYLVQCLAGRPADDDLGLGTCSEELPRRSVGRVLPAGHGGRRRALHPTGQGRPLPRRVRGRGGPPAPLAGAASCKPGSYEDSETPARAGLNFDPDVPASAGAYPRSGSGYRVDRPSGRPPRRYGVRQRRLPRGPAVRRRRGAPRVRGLR